MIDLMIIILLIAGMILMPAFIGYAVLSIAIWNEDRKLNKYKHRK